MIRARSAALLVLALASSATGGDEKTRGSDRVPLGSPQFYPSAARPVVRERVVPESREGGRRSVSLARRGAEPFKPTQVPSLLGSPVDYLIVTTDALVGAFQPLADWKTAKGVLSAVVTIEDIEALAKEIA